MTHYLRLSALLLFAGGAATAQVAMPHVEPYIKHSYCVELEGNYVPAGTFASTFPNFLADGQYRLDYTLPGWDARWGNYSSKKQPAIAVPFNGKKPGFQHVVATLSAADQVLDHDLGNMGMTWTPAWVYYVRKKKYRPQSDLNKFDRREVDEYNRSTHFFTATTDTLLGNAGITGTAYSDISQNDYRKAYVTPGTVILNFREEKIMVQTRKVSKDLPSFAYYTLTVRNAFGEVFKSYGQLVLLSLDENPYCFESPDGPQRMSFHIFTNTYKAAAQSLLNQFFNDDATIIAVKEHIQGVQQKITADATYAKLVPVKIKYAALKSYLADIAAISYDVTGSYNKYSSDINSNSGYKPVYVPNSSVSAEVNNAAGALGNAFAAAMDRSSQKAKEANNTALLAVLSSQEAEYNQQMADLSEEIAALPPSADKDALIAQIRQDKADLTGALDDALTAQKESANATATSRARNEQAMQNMNNAMQNLNNSLKPESAAISTASKDPNSPEAKQCAQEATNQMNADPKYQQYLKSQLQSDLDEAKALAIDYMVDHCSDFMTPQEIADLKKIAAQTRQEADQLRAGNNFNFKK